MRLARIRAPAFMRRSRLRASAATRLRDLLVAALHLGVVAVDELAHEVEQLLVVGTLEVVPHGQSMARISSS